MASKRTASTELNHDNWDVDEEPETSGKFQIAQPSVIANRLIKLATRRLNNSSGGVADTSKKEEPEKSKPSETIFGRLGGTFAPASLDKKGSTFFTSKQTANTPNPVLSNTKQDLLNTPRSASPTRTKVTESKRTKKDITCDEISSESSSDEALPETSAFRPMNPTSSRFGLADAWGTKTIVDAPSIDKPHVSLTRPAAAKPPLSKNQGSTSFMPCLETRPVVSCSTSPETEILAQIDSRDLLKPVPDDILVRLRTKSEATAKSLNFLKRMYQLNITTLDWLNILVNESLTVNIAEVIPSYMRELLKLIEEEIASQESKEAKQDLIPHKNQLQQMLDIFCQFGLGVEEDTSSSVSKIHPESAKNVSTLKSPLVTNNLGSPLRSSNSLETKNDTVWKIKTPSEEGQHIENVPSKPRSTAIGENHNNEQHTESEQTENGDDPSKAEPFTPVVEEDSICTMRCKVFVKKILDPSDPSDTPYQNRGVGTLFVKPVTRGKLQLVVRADNSLGNIVLNTCITPEIPVEIANSNTLMLVCCPMPGDIARTVLIRVKNKVQVDLLHTNLETV